MELCSSQSAIFQLFLTGPFLITLILAQVLTPQDAKTILKQHNEYRRLESASDMYLLHWNVSLQQRADSWAQRCIFKHERNLDLGENLYFDTDHEDDVFVRGMEEWHKEKSKWGYTSHSCGGSCHYTQVIWGYTTTVGCSANVCPSLNVAGRSVKDAMLFVCYYYPRGNFIGNFPYSRGRTCSECASGDSCSDGLCVSSGPVSKLAPDFVKRLTPQAPLSLSRSLHSFQAFRSLVQHFTLDASHESHVIHQQTHHSHHQQQRHQHFQSETVVSSGSQSQSYTAHHTSQQRHHQVYYSSQHNRQQQQHITEHQQQEQQRRESQKLDEQHKQQQEQENKVRQEMLQQERQKLQEIEKRREALIEEQQREIELEQSRQHLLVQEKLREERLQLDRLRTQDESRHHLLQVSKSQGPQTEEDELRHTETKDFKQQAVKKDIHRQSLQRVTDHESKKNTKTESVKVSSHHPAEIYRATESPYDYNLRRSLYHKTGHSMSTPGSDLQRQDQYIRIRLPSRHGDSSRGDQATALNVDDYRRRTVGEMTTPSWIHADVVKLLSNADFYNRSYENVAIPAWSGQLGRIGLSTQQKTHGNSDSARHLNRNFQIQDEVMDNIHVDDRIKEDNMPIDDEQFLEDIDSFQGRRQVAVDRRKHLKNKWKYRQSELQKIEEKHPHRGNYTIDTSGRRCVDRHTECIQWAAKCHKSTAVTLTCPKTCGKCGLHLELGEFQEVPTTRIGNNRRNNQERPQRKKRREKLGRQKLTPAERKERRRQRQLERSRNAPSALIPRPGSEVVDKRQAAQTRKEERQKRRMERQRLRKERQRQVEKGQSHTREEERHRQEDLRHRQEGDHHRQEDQRRRQEGDHHRQEDQRRRQEGDHHRQEDQRRRQEDGRLRQEDQLNRKGDQHLRQEGEHHRHEDQRHRQEDQRRGQEDSHHRHENQRRTQEIELQRHEAQRHRQEDRRLRQEDQLNRQEDHRLRQEGEQRHGHEDQRHRQESQRHTQARTDLCRDDPKHVRSCKFWAKKGFCLDNRLIGNIYCRQSCNSCQ